MREKIKDWTPTKIFLGIVLFVVILIFIWATTGKATTPEKSPSMNLSTHSFIDSDTNPTFWSAWDSNATGTTSGGPEYFPHCTHSQFILTYYNLQHAYRYNIYQSLISDLMAWWTTKGHSEPESVLVHWGNLVRQFTPGNDVYVMCPGWNESYDVNNNNIRDSISDWNHNWNQTNFTISGTTLTDNGGGKSHVTWGTNTWQNAVVLIGSTDANAETITVNSSTANTLVLSRAPAGSPNFYIVDKSRTWNHRQSAYHKSDAEVFVYVGSEPGEPAYYDTSYNEVAINFSLPDVQSFFGHDLASMFRTWRLSYSGTIGAFFDNDPWTDWRNDCMGWDQGFGDGWNSILETNVGSQSGYIQYMRQCNQVVNDSIHHNVSGQTRTVGNYGYYHSDQYTDYMVVGKPLDGAFWELRMDIECNLGEYQAWLNTFNDARDSGQGIYLMLKNTGYDTDSDTNKVERWLRAAGIYYCLMGHRTDSLAPHLFICDENAGGYATVDIPEWYRPQAKFNMGSLAGTCLTYTSGRSCFYRRYTNGIALLYPPQGGSLVVPLGRYYHLVLSDGTLSSDSVNSYTMNDVAYNAATGGMGRIFGISGSPPEDSLIQHLTPPTPLYPINGSMIWRDSLINLWGPPTDSVTLRVGTYNSFDSLVWKAHFTGADTGNLSVTGLLENTTYYYSAIAFEGSHRDSTEIASLTTTSIPLVSDKKIRRWRK